MFFSCRHVQRLSRLEQITEFDQISAEATFPARFGSLCDITFEIKWFAVELILYISRTKTSAFLVPQRFFCDVFVYVLVSRTSIHSNTR